MTEKINNREYAGLFIIDLMTGVQPEKIHVRWDGNSVQSDILDEPIVGDWSFSITLEALESREKKLKNHFSQDKGMEVILKKMVSTPISTTFYFTSKVDGELKQWKEENWEIVNFSYLVKDDLGHEYNVLPNGGGYGDSKFYVNSRITIGKVNKEASTLIITPVVYELKKTDDHGVLELVREPYPLEPIKVSLKD
jgi:hypothetical protein